VTRGRGYFYSGPYRPLWTGRADTPGCGEGAKQKNEKQMKIRKEAFGYTLFTEQTSGMSSRNASTFVVELGEEAIYAATTHLSAPEVVHLCITKRCNRNCEFCYVEKDDSEPSADEIKGLID